MRPLLGIVACGLLVAACAAGNEGPSVSDVRIGEPTGPNAALYLTVQGAAGDRLVAVSTDVAGSAEMHETTTEDDGTMAMTAVDSFEVNPDSGLVLEPGGKHVMLLDVDRLAPGDEVSVTLEFENAGSISLQVPVVAVTETMGEGDAHADH